MGDPDWRDKGAVGARLTIAISNPSPQRRKDAEEDAEKSTEKRTGALPGSSAIALWTGSRSQLRDIVQMGGDSRPDGRCTGKTAGTQAGLPAPLCLPRPTWGHTENRVARPSTGHFQELISNHSLTVVARMGLAFRFYGAVWRLN